MRFVHFSIVPQKLSVDFYDPKDQYYCAFKVSVSLRKGDAVVFQYTKDFSVEIPSKDLDRTQNNGIAIEDTFPVIEGNYQMAILLQNTVGKEFSVFEKPLSVADVGAAPRIDGPFVGYNIRLLPERYPHSLQARRQEARLRSQDDLRRLR